MLFRSTSPLIGEMVDKDGQNRHAMNDYFNHFNKTVEAMKQGEEVPTVLYTNLRNNYFAAQCMLARSKKLWNQFNYLIETVYLPHIGEDNMLRVKEPSQHMSTRKYDNKNISDFTSIYDGDPIYMRALYALTLTTYYRNLPGNYYAQEAK